MLKDKCIVLGTGVALAFSASSAMAVDPVWDQEIDLQGGSWTSIVPDNDDVNLRLFSTWEPIANAQGFVQNDSTVNAFIFDMSVNGNNYGSIHLYGNTLNITSGIFISAPTFYNEGTINFGNVQGTIDSRGTPYTETNEIQGIRFNSFWSSGPPPFDQPHASAVVTGTAGMLFTGETDSHRTQFISGDAVQWTGDTTIERGIVEFWGNNELDGASGVTVEADGTLEVNNTQTVASLTVDGGQIHGTGTIGNDVTFTSGAFGGGRSDRDAAIGTLNFDADVAFSGGGGVLLRVEDEDDGGTILTNLSLVDVTGALALDAASNYVVDIEDQTSLGGGLEAGQTYTLVTTGGLSGFDAGNWSVNGEFAGSSVFQSGDDIMLNVIPEPASLALFGAGGLLCLWRRRPHAVTGR